MAFQNCWVYVETRIEVGITGLDSGVAGRVNGHEKMV